MTVRELLDELSVSYKEHGESPHVSAGWVGLQCPYCGVGTNKFGLGIPPRGRRASCWKCGTHLLVDVLCEITGLPASVIRTKLGALDEDQSPATHKLAGHFQPPVGVTDLLVPHRRYLRRRGFDPDVIATTWGVKAIGPLGRYQWRLFIPVFATDGQEASWTTRAIGDVSLRYVSADPTSERVPLKQTLYGEHLVRDVVIVVEGPTDAWRIGPGAVAVYGAKYTAAQVARIARYPLRVVCLDRDARSQANRLADELAAFPGVTHFVELSGKDPDSSPPEEIAELRERFLS